MKKTVWVVDPMHSEVSFKVRHLMITNVTGLLTDYNIVAVSYNENFVDCEVTFKANAKSINTGNADRDKHLRSSDFFDVEENSEIIFKSSGLQQVRSMSGIFNEKAFILYGDLTIKRTTKPIILDVLFHGLATSSGVVKAGFSVSGKISRNEFGLTWNQTLESGGVMVSDEVKITCEIQMTKGAEA
jgi:polyisoprenoid-binding protein YceI